jgi:hypothetical protein
MDLCSLSEEKKYVYVELLKPPECDHNP